MAGGALAAEPARTAVRPVQTTLPTQTLAPVQTQPQTEAQWANALPRKQLQWDSKGRWGFRLDMNQPKNRESDWKDVQAGAFFRITPSMQVGGAVSLGDRLAQPKRVTPLDAGPRVHLETAFRF